MKCSHCGAELKDGSLFCAECGSKVETQKQNFCKACGHALSAGSKFCPECGASILNPPVADSSEKADCEPKAESAIGSSTNHWSNSNSGEYHVPELIPQYKQNSKSKEYFQKWKEKLIDKWNSLDTFLKIVMVALCLAILLLIIAVCSHRILASVISILQIAGLVIVTQMHKGKIKGGDAHTEKLVLGIMLAFFVLNFASRSISPIDTYRIRQAFEPKSEKTTAIQQNLPDYNDPDEILAGFRESSTTNTEVEPKTSAVGETESATNTTTQHFETTEPAATNPTTTSTTKPTTTNPTATKPMTTKPTTTKPTTTKPTTTKPTTTKPTTTKPTTTKLTTTKPATTKPTTNSSVSIGKQNALREAQSYLQSMPFSYSGLIKQLKYEGYTDEEADYAVKNCGANWKEQAVLSAKSYLQSSAFSKKGLIEQLKYEGFTTEEASYGVERCGANWNEQAAKSATSYLEYSAFSRQELIEQLEYEGFTHEQALYGVKSVGY